METEKKKYRLLDELAILNEGTWAIRPKGVLDFVISADDSGIDYDQDTPIFDVRVSRRVADVNQVKVNGGYVTGVLVESAVQENTENRIKYGPAYKEFTIAWLASVANANTMATAILNRMSAEYIEVIFKVKDATNGFIPPTEQITLEDTNKGTTSAQNWINQVMFNIKSGIAEYIVSSEVRWDLEDLEGKLQEDLSDQMGQIAATVVTNEAASASNPLTENLDVGSYTLEGYTASRALQTNGSGEVEVSSITTTELGYLDGASSNIQDQIDGKGEGNCSIKNGQYTGTGTNAYVDHQETGLGFDPIGIIIILDEAADQGNSKVIIGIKGSTTDRAHDHVGGTSGIVDMRVQLITDGFAVSDDNSNYHPNELNQVYNYIAWG